LGLFRVKVAVFRVYDVGFTKQEELIFWSLGLEVPGLWIWGLGFRV
jgi:hypothetical protein